MNFLSVQCNAMVDCSFYLSGENGSDVAFLARHRLPKNQVTMASSEQVAAIAKEAATLTVDGKAPILTPGGSGCNSARLALWLLQQEAAGGSAKGCDGGGGATRPVTRISVLSAVGEDEHGSFMRSALGGAGVETTYLLTAPMNTGFCVTLVTPDGERTFAATSSGAWSAFGSCADSAFQAAAAQAATAVSAQMAQIVLITGYALVSGADFVLSKRLPAVSNESLLVSSISGVFVAESFGAALSELVSASDIVFSNLEEAAGYLNFCCGVKEKHSVVDAAEMIAYLICRKRKQQPVTVIVTDGSGPLAFAVAAVSEAEEDEKQDSGRAIAHRSIMMPVEKVKVVVDSTGAGDALVAGVLASLKLCCPAEEKTLSGWWRKEALAFAMYEKREPDAEFLQRYTRHLQLGCKAAAVILGVSGVSIDGVLPPHR